jgi:hypothetical protein
VLLLIRWAEPEAIHSISLAGACSNFRMPFDKRKFSHYEYPSLCVRLRFPDDARSSNHSMDVHHRRASVVPAVLRGKALRYMRAHRRSSIVFGVRVT